MKKMISKKLRYSATFKPRSTLSQSLLNKKVGYFYLLLVIGVLANKITCEQSNEEKEIKDIDYFGRILNDLTNTAMAFEKLSDNVPILMENSSENDKMLNAKRSLADLVAENGKKKYGIRSGSGNQKPRPLGNKIKNMNKTGISSSDLERHRNMLRVIFSYGK